MGLRARVGPRAASVLTVALLLAGCDDVSVNVLPVESLEISPEQVTILEGEERTLSLVLRGPNGEVLSGSGRQIAWTSDNPGVASVDSGGRVRGEAAGSTVIRASSDGASASVAVEVLPGPSIGVPTDEVEFRGPAGQTTPLERSLAVENEGEGTLTGLSVTVEIEDPEGPQWLEATLGGSLAPTNLRLRAHFDGLEPGVYRGEVTLSAEVARNSPLVIEVEFHVEEPPPEVGLSPTSIAFTAVAGSREPASQVVIVTNVGGGALTSLEVSIQFLDGASQGWLAASLDADSAPTLLTLQALARDLGPGVYRAEVEVLSAVPGALSAIVEVVFNVSASLGTSMDDG